MLLKTSNRDYVWAHINILYIQKCVLGCTNTCVWKSISKGMRHLNKCSFYCSDELCKAEVLGEAMQVLWLCMLWTHSPAGVKGYDFFRVQLANLGKHQQPTSFCTVLTVGLRKFEKRNLYLAFFGGRNWQDLSLHSCLFHFSKSQQRRSMQSAFASH